MNGRDLLTDNCVSESVLREEPCTDPYARFCGQTEAAASSDPIKFLIYERWAEPSFEAFVEHQLKGKRYRDEYESKVSEWLVEDRAISVLEPMGEWQK